MQYKTSKVFRILATLQSGEAKTIDRVATETGIAPTRVLQSLKWLSEVGVPIIWMSGKKIRINTKIHPLNYEYIEQYISQLTKDTDIEIVLMDSVDSTNEYLLSLCTNRSIHKTICLAEHMTHGRGRQQKKWVAGAFQNVMMSVGWEFHSGVQQLSGLSLAIAVMVVRCLKRISHQPFEVKWPNDILWHKRKLSGILIEIKDHFVVVGVGVNCSLSSSAIELIDQPVASMGEFCDIAPKRNQLVAELIVEMCAGLERFSREQLKPFREEWEQWHAYHNRQMRQMGSQIREGHAVGIDESGALLLRQEDGQILPIRSGEIVLSD